MARIEDLIRSKAKGIGIDAVGFTRLYDADGIRERLLGRKELGYSTEFEPDLEDRLHPERLLDGFKSIISIGISYNVKTEERQHRFSGRVSRSTLGIDYHLLVRSKLEELMDFLQETAEFDYYIGVDTSPLVDREIAESSGIGFFGKNNSVISEELGSFIFLGYALVSLELGNESEKGDFEGCGDCNLCIKACPTGALKEGNLMDATRCISYLTQIRLDIPYDLRAKMNKSIYGCDICQNVCPKNAGRVEANPANFSEVGSLDLDLEELLFITNREFKERHGSKSYSWRGKNLLRRNAIIALANSKDQCAVPLFERLLADESQMIRSYALWAIYMLDRPRADALKESFIDEFERMDRFYAR